MRRVRILNAALTAFLGLKRLSEAIRRSEIVFLRERPYPAVVWVYIAVLAALSESQVVYSQGEYDEKQEDEVGKEQDVVEAPHREEKKGEGSEDDSSDEDPEVSPAQRLQRGLR